MSLLAFWYQERGRADARADAAQEAKQERLVITAVLDDDQPAKPKRERCSNCGEMNTVGTPCPW